MVKNTRRFSGRRTIDVSGLDEYAVVLRFDRFDEFESLTEQEDIPVEEWEKRVRDRLSHFALIRRADMTAPGLSHSILQRRREFLAEYHVLVHGSRP